MADTTDDLLQALERVELRILESEQRAAQAEASVAALDALGEDTSRQHGLIRRIRALILQYHAYRAMLLAALDAPPD